MAENRVAQRVKKGGHNIPNEIIKRRYFRGIKNLFGICQPISYLTLIYDNSENDPVLIYEKGTNEEAIIHKPEKNRLIISQSFSNER